ncbi:TPA: hypothetical protein DE059_01855 [Candidatus Peribacteria bacterium]|jgi:hypothetical protein|nr:hypothetical protein [Candidatus Peribacteria bacterium]
MTKGCDVDNARRCTEPMGLYKDSVVSVMVQARPNRGFNADAGKEYAQRVRELFGCRSVQVVSRVDDVEIWPNDRARLMSMSVAERMETLQDVTRGTVMDAVPLLQQMDEQLEAADVPFVLIKQPESNSFTEGYWTVFGGDPRLAPPAETTDIIQTASSRALQKRLVLGMKDGCRNSETSTALRQANCLRHDEVNSGSEMISLAIARVARVVLGSKRYVDMSLGEAAIGAAFKRFQLAKIRRAERLLRNKEA